MTLLSIVLVSRRGDGIYGHRQESNCSLGEPGMSAQLEALSVACCPFALGSEGVT